jgi:hypothetical protein
VDRRTAVATVDTEALFRQLQEAQELVIKEGAGPHIITKT